MQPIEQPMLRSLPKTGAATISWLIRRTNPMGRSTLRYKDDIKTIEGRGAHSAPANDGA
jgi:hypothetical protein